MDAEKRDKIIEEILDAFKTAEEKNSSFFDSKFYAEYFSNMKALFAIEYLVDEIKAIKQEARSQKQYEREMHRYEVVMSKKDIIKKVYDEWRASTLTKLDADEDYYYRFFYDNEDEIRNLFRDHEDVDITPYYISRAVVDINSNRALVKPTHSKKDVKVREHKELLERLTDGDLTQWQEMVNEGIATPEGGAWYVSMLVLFAKYRNDREYRRRKYEDLIAERSSLPKLI